MFSRASDLRISPAPPDKDQDFIWDAHAKASGLGARATPRGKTAFVFQSVYNKKTFRKTIGGIEDWQIPEARKRSRELQQLIDSGRDPRVAIAEQTKKDEAARKDGKMQTLTVQDAWDDYLKIRKPEWSINHYRDQRAMAQKGGEPRPRWKGAVTKAGPLWPLMNKKLSEIDAEVMERWARKEVRTRPSSTRLAKRHFKTFIRWCSEESRYKKLVERFNRTYRDEVLNMYVFKTLTEVRARTEEWMNEYNEERPHDSLGDLTPLEFMVASKRPGNSNLMCH